MRPRTICFIAGSSGDWGGASRVLFTNLQILDRSLYEPLVLLPSHGPIEANLRQWGMRYEIWGPDREPVGAMQYAKDIYRSASFFVRSGTDLLHVNHAGYWRPAEILAAKLLRIPVVTHYHRVVPEPSPYTRYSSLIAAVSEYVAKNSGPEGIPKAVIHNSVQLQRFDEAVDIRCELGLQPGDVAVAFVGQIRAIKGIDLFIKMARRVRNEKARFIIAGECRDPERFAGSYNEERLNAEIGGDCRIRYIGYRYDIENVFRAADLVVMPSRWEEPFGLINIEAGAARKPVVSTREGGIPEIIEHGENGFLVQREDLDALVHHVQLLTENEALRRRMGERGREIVEARFTRQPVRKLEQAYGRLLDAKRNRQEGNQWLET